MFKFMFIMTEGKGWEEFKRDKNKTSLSKQ